MPKSVLLSDKLITDAQVEFWAQPGKACEENPELPTPLIKTYLDGINDDLDEIVQDMIDNPDELRSLFQELAPSFDPFANKLDPRSTVEYLFHLVSVRLKETTKAIIKTRENLNKR